MNIIILDDYQDAVRKLKCAAKLEPLNAKVFTNTVKGIGQLSVRLRDADVLVLIRERTQFPRALLEKALAANPQHQRALWLLGISDAQAGDAAGAVRRWETLLPLLPKCPELNVMENIWPFFILAPAFGFYAMYLLGGRDRGLLVPAAILTVIGVVFLMQSADYGMRYVWPIALIVLGALLLLRGARGGSGDDQGGAR